MVEIDQHIKIAKLIADIDPTIPTTLLAFFPTYKLTQTRAPKLNEMMVSFAAMKHQGLKHLRLGNVGVFAKTNDDLQSLLASFGERAIG
jgi:pyruvate-formate lyase-activating enzyme